jgi:benzodiazapine receptor
MQHRMSLLYFVFLVVGGGLTIGFITAPGIWYAELAKPPFNPPNWLFAPVWTAIYLLIAIAGWRIWERNWVSWPMVFWLAQLLLNFIWSPIFFAAQRIDLALLVILLLLLSILGFIIATWRLDRMASWLFVPYAVWVSFASLLNASILILNSSR